MAITIQAQPTSSIYYSAGNPVEYLVSSTNTALSNFKIIAKVYETTTTPNLLGTLYLDIIPDTTQVFIDIQRILKSTLSEATLTNLITEASGLKNESTRIHTCVTTFQEYYGAVPTASGSTSSGNTFYYWNGQLKYNDWLRGDVAKYRLNSAAVANTLNQRLLTGFANYTPTVITTASGATYFQQGNVRKIKTSQIVQLMALWEGTSGGKAMRMLWLNSSFGYQYELAATQTGTTNVLSINVGEGLWNGSGYGNDTSGAKYFCCAVYQSYSPFTYQITGTYLFELDDTCTRFDSYEIHWLNRYGGWDSWVFDKRATHTTEIERRTFNQTTLPISGSNIVHNTYDINNKNYAVLTKERYRLNSGYLKAWELEGLEHLLTSPNVYWNSADGFINIAIENPEKHEHKTNTVDKLFSLTFEFVIDNSDVRL